MLTLRDYQEEIVTEVRKAFREKYRKILTVLPCGGGKTVIFAQMAALATKNNKKVLFLVHRRELLDQTVATFEKFNIPPVEITTVQSFVRNLNDTHYDMIIFDEAHHSSSNTWLKIIEHYKNSYIIGLTATPCRLDGKPLGMIYEKMIIGSSANELTEKNYLCQYKYFAPTLADLSELKKKGSDYDMDSVYEILDKPRIYGDIVETYRNIAKGKKAICYCPNISFSKKIAGIFKEAGINAVHFDADTPKNVRKSIISDFRQGKISILCNVDLISEGFDVPDCECVILLRPTQSAALYIQQACRPLRPEKSKPYAIIIDHVSNYMRFGFPTDDREWDLGKPVKMTSNFDKEGNYIVKVCDKCFRTFKSAPKCPFCGNEYKTTEKEIQQINSIKIQEINRQKMAALQRQKDNFRNMIRGKVESYKSYLECKNKMELSEFCKKNNFSHKTFIYYAIKHGFIRTKKGS